MQKRKYLHSTVIRAFLATFASPANTKTNMPNLLKQAIAFYFK